LRPANNNNENNIKKLFLETRSVSMQTIITDDLSCKAESRVSAVNKAIAEEIGAKKYRIWFENSTRLTIAEGYVKIGVPNLFIANWIESHFAKEINRAVERVTEEKLKITFAIDPELAGRGKQIQLEPAKKIVNQQQGKATQYAEKKSDKYEKLKLNLDNFVVGSSNELAYNTAKAVANNDKVSFNPLFIHGGYGVGKTHLLQGICNAVQKNRPGTNWLYLSAEDFVNQFVLALKTKKLEAFRRRMRQTDLLAIDDIHFLASKLSSQEEFLHTFNSIDLAGKQVVLASDAHPKLIGRLSDKLVNRFISGMVVKIENPDLNTRCQICKQFALHRRLHIPESVIRYIAENIRSNVRELQGAVLKLIAFSALQNQKINLHAAKEILSEHLSRTDPIVHISDIESAVAAFFSITAADLHSSKKDRTISLARHFSMYLARKHTNMSSPEIGKCMGNKNHATVLLACKRIEDQIKQNEHLHWNSPAGNKVSKARTILAKLENAIAG
jgi:chromosomal replication initiator protein